MPDLTVPVAKAAALAEFHEGMYAGSSRHSMAFKWKTILRAFADWGTEPYPPSIGKVHWLGATLKAGGYRSAAGYLSLYRSSCARAGHGFGPELAVAMRDAARSCSRGLGGPLRASPLPLEQLHALRGDRSPWVAGGPCSPRNAIVAGTWWLLREIELATVPAHLVEVTWKADRTPLVSLTLPASKTDQAARGAARCHRCRCESVGSAYGCPAHAVLDQMAFLQRQFPHLWVDGRPDPSLPLFPGLAGTACSKPAMVGTMVAAATQLAVPLANADGTTRVSGHSLRVGGAQGLARAGFPLWSIQLFGRWGGEAVKAYVGEAALDVFTCSPTAGGAEQVELTTLLAAALQTGPPTDRPTEPADRGAHALAPGSGRRHLPEADRLEELVATWAGDLRHELREALSLELRVELARRASPTPAATRDQAAGTEVPWVRNERTHIWHVSAVGPGSGQPSRRWASVCGWAFGCSGGFALEAPPEGCERCERCVEIMARRAL